MKNKLKLFGCTLLVLAAMVSCNESEIISVLYPGEPNENTDDTISTIGSIKVNNDNYTPLTGYLTNLKSENFEMEGKDYYCFLLKLEKTYPVHVYYPNGSEALFNLSYSINFKFFSEREKGPLDEVLTVELLDDILPYYQALEPGYAANRKTVAFLFGDRSLDPTLDGYEYINYLKSYDRIKTGTIHIAQKSEKYLITFDGETAAGEKVNCQFYDTLTFGVDHQLETREVDYSTTTIPENYILKDGKYYPLNEGYYFIFSPTTYEGDSIQTIQVITQREYYWNEAISGMVKQHYRSSALYLQFQFGESSQFNAKTYHVAPSEGIYSMRNPVVPFEGFPNDSLVIGYYHTAIDASTTLTYDEDQEYMNSQIALASGTLEVTKNSSNYSFSGSFLDAKGEEVKVKFKAKPYPWDFSYK